MHPRQVDLSGKLQIKPGQSAAVLNAPPGLALPGVRSAPPPGEARYRLAKRRSGTNQITATVTNRA